MKMNLKTGLIIAAIVLATLKFRGELLPAVAKLPLLGPMIVRPPVA